MSLISPSYLCPAFSGPPLLELLDNMQLVDRKYNAPLMMPISEKYKDMGTVIVGKLESGKVLKGNTVLMMPNKVCSKSPSPKVSDSY